MPPNTQAETATEDDQKLSFAQHFWSKDKSGVNQLFQYIQSTHQDLKEILEIYLERARIEQEFGEKLARLATRKSQPEKNSIDTTQSALAAIYHEIQKTSECHLTLSSQLKDQVADEIDRKIKEYNTLFDKWTVSLNHLGSEKKEKIHELLKIRAKYLREHEMSNGQTTSSMALLKEEYKALVEQVDSIAQEWNSTWTETCEVMEAMEEDRVELIKSNVWEYANLTSATLLVQDEELENCNFEQELKQCIELHSTGSVIPTTNDYVTEIMREQKRKQQMNKPKPTTPNQDHHEEPNERKQDRIRPNISSNIGSTAMRGQIRRKPLNKALMEQVTNEMAMTRQQSQTEEKQPPISPSTSTTSHSSDKPTGSRETTVEPVTEAVHPNATVSEEARARRQPSEYKPDTGSIPIRKPKNSQTTTPNHMLKDMTTEQEFMSAHPIMPPKSPRPSAQQIFPNEVHPYNSISSNRQPYTNSQYDTLQYSLRSPMMQSMASPMMQAHRSPMMQPIASPMMQAHRSPMMQPMASPVMGPQQHMLYDTQSRGPQARGTLPPPITIPGNYGPSPQASPAVVYANLNCVSPGGVLPPPMASSPYMAPSVPRPHQFSDGRSIQFWARAKYDYVANDADELSFKAHQLIGVLEADMTQQSWWYGAIWDEYRQVWSVAGSVPSNFMDTS
ncbi:hypothetical protein BD560DRAFT_324662 [Blakeslea trispora]|nr:hypothetical protein BD560DRAFT_324662 [Blakeslea trispora]